jgi:hypothetical protein
MYVGYITYITHMYVCIIRNIYISIDTESDSQSVASIAECAPPPAPPKAPH